MACWVPAGYRLRRKAVAARHSRPFAKSRPLEKVSADGANASIAVAQIAPTLGMVINREATSSCLARGSAWIGLTPKQNSYANPYCHRFEHRPD